jgi:hypothetical protein
MSFDWKLLFGVRSIPSEVARFSESPISPGADGNLRTPGQNRLSKNSANERYRAGSNSFISMWYLRTKGFGYRPELHYMRGPGPKWRESYGRLRKTR